MWYGPSTNIKLFLCHSISPCTTMSYWFWNVFLGSVPASIRDFVGPWVGPRKTLIVLIGFQTPNKIHLASREVAVRVTMYVYTDRNPFFFLQYECTLLSTSNDVRSESTREWEYKKQDKVAVRITMYVYTDSFAPTVLRESPNYFREAFIRNKRGKKLSF